MVDTKIEFVGSKTWDCRCEMIVRLSINGRGDMDVHTDRAGYHGSINALRKNAIITSLENTEIIREIERLIELHDLERSEKMMAIAR